MNKMRMIELERDKQFRSPHSVVANVLDCNIVVSEFKL